MRPKLRPDVRFVPAGGGVQVFSTIGSFGLAGASVEPLLDQLVGQLDGNHPLDSIVDGLPERHRRVVTKLINTLVERRVAYDAAAVRPHQLQEWELARYSQEVAYADLATGSGGHWFERFRLAEVLLVGAGGTLDALVGTMLQLGARGAHVLATDHLPGSRDRHRSSLATCRRDDPLVELTEVPDPGRWGSVTEIRSWLAGYQVVVHCDDRPRLPRAARLNRAARAAGIPALHAVIVGDSAWLGPVAGADLGCWECAWRYLLGARSRSAPGWADLQLDRPGRAGPTQAPAPIRSMVGAMLAMACFRLITEAGAGAAATNRLVRIDLETATAREHRFVRHPGCQACPPPEPPVQSAVIGRLAAMRASAVRCDADLSQAAAALHDPALGTILALDEPDHVQLPLVVTVATVNDLTGSGPGPRTVAAAAPDHLRARRRVAVRALEIAAGLAIEASPLAEPGWAWEVATETVVPLPPAAGPAGRTVAAGYRWEEAVGRGLLRHSARLARDGPVAAGRPLAVPLPDLARQLIEAAELLGGRLRLADRTELSGVPAVAIRGAGETPLVVAALDLPDALVAALEVAVGRLQAAVGGGELGRQPASAGVPTAADIPLDLGDERWPSQLGWLAGCLAERGWRALARPLVLAPALVDRLPLLAEVTLVPVPAAGPE
jgi:bacteriocin biosynthesis cyclodehydratase domain-containing protein